ncbi:MAG: PAS domain S-box protein [Kiritimatiellae bacterium]|nr:PAS domain S-box protein [Kiritimatiellia bacterium]
MANVRHVSLVQPPPPGFAGPSPSAKDLLGGYIVLLTHREEEVAALVPDYRNRLRGLLAIPGGPADLERIGGLLWKIGVAQEELSAFHRMAGPILELVRYAGQLWDGAEQTRLILDRYSRDFRVLQQDFHGIASKLQRHVMQADAMNVKLDGQMRKLSETMSSLRESERRYRALFEGVHILISVHDLEGVLLEGNREFYSTLGYRKRDVGRLKIQDFWERIPFAGSPGLGTGAPLRKPLYMEGEYRDARGEWLPVQVGIHPMRLGRQPVLMITARDVRERREMENISERISERERQLLGWEIHDGLGQYLSALTFQCKTLAQKIGAAGSLSPADIDAMAALVDEAVQEARSIAQYLFPGPLLEHNFRQALAELVEMTARHFSADCRLIYELAREHLSPDISMHLYRIVQEALRNDIRHGQATRIRVILRPLDDVRAELVMESDGRPALRQQEKRAGLGLAIMTQRARLIGAELTYGLGVRSKTLLRCAFPLGESPRGEASV